MTTLKGIHLRYKKQKSITLSYVLYINRYLCTYIHTYLHTKQNPPKLQMHIVFKFVVSYKNVSVYYCVYYCQLMISLNSFNFALVVVVAFFR